MVKKQSKPHARKYTKKCPTCGDTFKAARQSAKFCSDSCRQISYDKRKEKATFQKEQETVQSLMDATKGLILLIELESDSKKRLEIYDDMQKQWHKKFSKSSKNIKKVVDANLYMILRNCFDKDDSKAYIYVKN